MNRPLTGCAARPGDHFLPLGDVTVLFPESTASQNSHFPPKHREVLLPTFPSLLSKAELDGETISGQLIHFSLDNLKIWVIFIASFSQSNKKAVPALCVCRGVGWREGIRLPLDSKHEEVCD